EEPFSKIAELRIDGTISVQTAERPQAYRLGIAKGQSFPIAAYGHDHESPNILDQIEIIYTYNPVEGLYEQNKITRIPGAQTEERRLRELLSGDPGVFENFIDGLWYYISPQGTLDNRQYIYFDTLNREIIFYGDEAQQIFTWQNSSASRYGLYLASQNISVSTLRRFLDIELESLDSIRIKVFEDVRLKIGVNAPWNGSYRKVEIRKNPSIPNSPPPSAYIDAQYEGAIGNIIFSPDGTYTLQTDGVIQKGRYAFFPVNGQEILELRGEGSGPLTGGNSRETYLVDGAPNPEKAGEGNNPPRENLLLLRVRLGAGGIQELHETAVSLSLVKP
ncbi:MAG: pallilysin-related adhesin, partial [Treponema sp.]|nr:pallilysin-related adhesin [Treponema sp.]